MRSRLTYGEAILIALRGAAAHVAAHAEEINALNVFPVPDGDTGSNMAATVRAALAEAEAVPPTERALARVAAAVRFGALMGARGNSGVILSQVLRGMTEVGETRSRVTGLDLAHALRRGSETAYAAILTPIEGTILTVVRETADAAVARAEQDPDLGQVLAAAVEAAEDAVARTPSLLPILRDAGVVDSGGQGLFRLLEGALLAMRGEMVRDETVRGAVATTTVAAPLSGHAETGFGYETMFLLTSPEEKPLDLDTLRRELDELGDSVLVAGDEHQVKVHIHNERPDRIIGYGLALGTLTRISIENLDSQALDASEARARAFTGVTEPAPAGSAAHVARTAVVAVAPGLGLASAMEAAGAGVVVTGGQSANPSVDQLREAAEATGAEQVLILPNNGNVRLTAQQAADLLGPDRVVVLPTRTAAEGIGALLAFDRQLDAPANAAAMTSAAARIRTLSVTVAVRNARFGERSVRRGQTIVLDAEDGLLAAHRHRTPAICAAVAGLAPGYELITLYYGEDADQRQAKLLAGRLSAIVGTAEVEIVDGGQPHYSYLIAVE